MESTALRFEYQVEIKRTPRQGAPCDRVVPAPTMADGTFAPIQNLLALAHVIEERIRTGVLPNHTAAARWLGVTRARISQIVGLTLLAPSIQERIVRAQGREVASLHERNLRAIIATEVWTRQESLWEGVRTSADPVASASEPVVQ